MFECRRIIFLDVDGVLNTTAWYEALSEAREKDPKHTPLDEHLPDEQLHLLDNIVQETGAEIVVSSSWRAIPSLYGWLKSELKRAGLSITDATPVTQGNRGDEINAWLKKNPDVSSFVILDDDCDMGELIDHLVWTSFDEGLTPTDARAAIELLLGRNMETPAISIQTTDGRMTHAGECSVNIITKEVKNFGNIDMNAYETEKTQLHIGFEIENGKMRIHDVVAVKETRKPPLKANQFWTRVPDPDLCT